MDDPERDELAEALRALDEDIRAAEELLARPGGGRAPAERHLQALLARADEARAAIRDRLAGDITEEEYDRAVGGAEGAARKLFEALGLGHEEESP